MKNQLIMAVIIVALIFGGGGFLSGVWYQKSQSPAVQTGRNGNLANRRFFQMNNAQRPVRGEILSRDDRSITVKLADGSSKIVLVSAATVITENTKTEATALVTGKSVLIFGTQNSDGTITAQNINLGLQFGPNQQPNQ